MNSFVDSREAQREYVVGGIRLKRPFKIRRLGHFGIDVIDPESSRDFYEVLLGLKVSDPIDMGFVIPADTSAEVRQGLGSSIGYFMRMGTDHHSFVLFPKKVMRFGRPPAKGFEQVTTNQITWQVGSLEEVVNAVEYLTGSNVFVRRSGRDLPGSNWHVYPLDTEGHPNELYYGMEQIGWDGYSKPPGMHRVRYTHAPDLPHRSEYAEVQEGYQDNIDPRSGFRHQEPQAEVYEVGGVLLGRPFKITKIGPIRLFVNDIQQACAFYRDVMGLMVTQEVEWKGHRCIFLRANTEHHSIALYPIALREELGLNSYSTLFSFGFQVGDYQQLKSALEFLQAKGVVIRHLPSELTPGIDYSAYAVDPDGNAVELYYYMEQIGWDGKPRPVSVTPVTLPWPEVIEEKSDSLMGETFLGPLA